MMVLYLWLKSESGSTGREHAYTQEEVMLTLGDLPSALAPTTQLPQRKDNVQDRTMKEQ